MLNPKTYNNSGFERLNVAAVIIQQNKVLLCQRSMTKSHKPGLWHLPGGKIEDGEDIFEALSREISEELDLEVTKITFVSKYYFDYKHGDQNARTIFCFCQVFGQITLNHENQNHQYVAFDQLDQYLEPQVLQINLNVINDCLASQIL
jgi:8-oxo-dGTP diphosphatase